MLATSTDLRRELRAVYTQLHADFGRHLRMDLEMLKKAHRLGAAQAEGQVVLWLRLQAKIAREQRRSYIARWIERLADAIERGEHQPPS